MYKLFILVLFAAISCKNQPKVENDTPNHFGAEFTAENVLQLDDVINQLATQDTVVAMMSGKVESVCKKKGCWMNINSSNASSDQSIFVKFKDYGFFMPLDCEGREVVMTGKAFKEVTSVDELRHYAEDEGKSEEEIAQITEPVEEFKFVADGVQMK